MTLLTDLKSQLEKDLKYIISQKIFSDKYFENIRIWQGTFKHATKNTTAIMSSAEEKNYFFLQLPYLPGFLLESTSDHSCLFLHKATRSSPILTNNNGDIIKNDLFILKSGILEEFRLLSHEYVRTTEDKTLSVKQFSETLLLLAESYRQAP